MAVPIYVVDAFTDRAFAGNPAGVCLLDAPRDETWMQAVAAEMKHSETAFILPEADGFHLRWFTPAVEVDLCGHATLASAHVLWESGLLAPEAVARFRTRSGMLLARRAGELIELDFPATPPQPAEPPAAVITALGARALWTGKSVFDWLVLLENETVVRELDPDMTLLARDPARGVIVTAAATTPGFDFVSRFFAPGAGIPEDPVTGSAHCTLGPFWGARLSREEMAARQVSARGGTVRVRLAGDRVMLGGRAVTILSGTLSV